MHNEENITCDICGIKVASITRSGLFNRPKRYTEFSYVTIKDTKCHYMCCDGSATDSEVHLCHDCFRDLKVEVLCKKPKETKDEQKTDN